MPRFHDSLPSDRGFTEELCDDTSTNEVQNNSKPRKQKLRRRYVSSLSWALVVMSSSTRQFPSVGLILG